MTQLISTPFNPTLEATYLFNAQCPNYLGQIWEIRKNDDLSSDISSLADRMFTYLKNQSKQELCLDLKYSNFLQSAYALSEKAFSKKGADSEIFGMKYKATQAYEKAKLFERLIEQYNNSKTFEEVAVITHQLNESHFISEQLKDKMKKLNVIPMSLSEFGKVSNSNKDVYARDVQTSLALEQHRYREKLEGLSHSPTDVYISPLYSNDIDTIMNREKNEIIRYELVELEKFLDQFPALKLDRCLNIDLSVQPIEAAPNPSSGSYEFIRSCISLGKSEFLEKVNRLLAFTKLKIIETGISTSLIIYNNDGSPFAIFKPSLFAGGSLENPKGTKVAMGSDIIEQASLKEVAASKVMNSISGAPETHLVEINLGGQALQGSLQAYVPHNQSVDKLFEELQHAFAEALGFDIPKEVWEKIMRREAVPMEDEIKFLKAAQYIQAIQNSSYGMYIKQLSLKNYYNSIGRILPEEVQQVGLHQLMTGNTDMNPANFLLAEKLDGGLQLIPVDFNLSFQKERAPSMAQMSISFWVSHPHAIEPMAPGLISYFKEYNVREMAHQLRELGLDEERVINFELRATLIQKAVSEGLTLAETAYLFVPTVIKDNPFPQYEKTTSEKLITSFYKSYDQASNQEDKEAAMAQYREEVTREVDALVQRLSDPKSFENKIRDLKKSLMHPTSLKEFSLNYLELIEITGLSKINPNFKIATDKQIEEDEQKICFVDFLK